MQEQDFVSKIIALGGRAYVVGGWVRDKLRGKAPKDKDYVVTGIEAAGFKAVFPESKLIGRAFPVYLLPVEGKHCEVAFARRERKCGTGYTGFQVACDKTITIEEDLYRRDLTVNSIAQDLATGELVDPYGGREDIAKGILRPVSEHFREDPVRALRAARFAASLEYQATDKLVAAMAACRDELLQEPGERILGEFTRALAAEKPARFFRLLQQAALLQTVFPELYALIGKTQPVEFHPEGDAFEHVMQIVDQVAGDTESLIARFAALAHDLGKGVTPEEMLPHHYGHEFKGLAVLDTWNQRVTLPAAWLKAARFVIEQHMRAPRLEKPGKIVELLLGVHKLDRELPMHDFKAIIRADHNGLPAYLEQGEELLALLLAVSGKDAPRGYRGKRIGEWIHTQQQGICREWLKIHNW